MPDREYRKDFKFAGGTPGKGNGSEWKCCWCGKIVGASWGNAAKHHKNCGHKPGQERVGLVVIRKLQELGNFTEFDDSNDPGEVSEICLDAIEDAIRDAP